MGKRGETNDPVLTCDGVSTIASRGVLALVAPFPQRDGGATPSVGGAENHRWATSAAAFAASWRADAGKPSGGISCRDRSSFYLRRDFSLNVPS